MLFIHVDPCINGGLSTWRVWERWIQHYSSMKWPEITCHWSESTVTVEIWTRYVNMAKIYLLKNFRPISSIEGTVMYNPGVAVTILCRGIISLWNRYQTIRLKAICLWQLIQNHVRLVISYCREIYSKTKTKKFVQIRSVKWEKKKKKSLVCTIFLF